ncbi:photosynthetic reaction center subunit H [Marivita sp. GX14005]|uniref:photosynthetic reaction center subunit H n=1 Tax=Marivita sp. GX14005 TaxID=2942276 RepID=UPI0020199C5C|nr:photosynthetic reaction center subunit H [Marivita sp. GX14005]MCL3883065.1 photosynthetic reaction center subunit H [Marivita sp. GX14005]
MLGHTFFGDFDLASAAIWAFWVFFALLVYYLQTENMREGYPLEEETKKGRFWSGLFSLPSDKTFHLPHGRGSVSVPSQQRGDRHNVALERSSETSGFPYLPTGDPMQDGVGPASWANRRDVPELDGLGHPKIRPLSTLPEFKVSGGRDPRGKAVVAGDGEVVGRVIDMWIDVPESLVRFLTVDLNPEGTGQTRLIPINLCRIKSDRVAVRSLYGAQFAGVPQIKAEDRITLLEEEKIMAWYAGGTLYADPKRLEAQL